MATKKVVPTISKYEEFEHNLSGYLDKNHQLTLLLDYDGTLAPIVQNPCDASLCEPTANLLKKFAVHPQIFLGFISGRGLDDIKSKIEFKNVTYGGNHGLQIEHPDGSRSDYELSSELKQKYSQMVTELKEKVNKHGAWSEDKIFSLTFHYRDTPEEFAEDLKAEATKIIKSYGFEANQAHCAIEAKPPVNWNKGEAALLILKRKFGDNWQSKTKVIFAGDDTTDEDAMKALQGNGNTFRISANPNFQTYADFRLPSQSLTVELLRWIGSVYN